MTVTRFSSGERDAPDLILPITSSPVTTPISGNQFILRAGGYDAVIASVGASLRSLTFEGRDLVVPFREDELRPVYRGAMLAPWPNRVVGGTYEFGGAPEQLPITEVERGHALHGLVVWADFAKVESSDTSVVLTASVPAQAGYPHQLRIRVAYRLDAAGLSVTVTAENIGTSVAPVGLGSHPYLVGGAGRVDDWTVEIPAEEVLLVDELLAPTELTRVAGSEFDFREPRPIGDTFIDHAYTALVAGSDGLRRVRVHGREGSGVEMVWGSGLDWLQIHTADRPDATSRCGLAVEPMTCPPDAFNSGTDLIALEPQASTSASWSIAAIHSS